jgi:hypothetical protein
MKDSSSSFILAAIESIVAPLFVYLTTLVVLFAIIGLVAGNPSEVTPARHVLSTPARDTSENLDFAFPLMRIDPGGQTEVRTQQLMQPFPYES